MTSDPWYLGACPLCTVETDVTWVLELKVPLLRWSPCSKLSVLLFQRFHRFWFAGVRHVLNLAQFPCHSEILQFVWLPVIDGNFVKIRCSDLQSKPIGVDADLQRNLTIGCCIFHLTSFSTSRKVKALLSTQLGNRRTIARQTQPHASRDPRVKSMLCSLITCTSLTFIKLRHCEECDPVVAEFSGNKR